MNCSVLIDVKEERMKKSDLAPRDYLEALVLSILAGILFLIGAVIFLADFDRIFPASPTDRLSAESRQAVQLVASSGALDRRLEAVDNPLKPSAFPVSNFLDIDQASKRQASNRRP